VLRELRPAPEHRRQEEPRQQERAHEVLDVPIERVEASDRQRQAGDEADEERGERNGEQLGVP
jgi:hypothetical protein